MKKLFIYSLLAASFLVASCSQPVMRLKPVARQTFWSDGREVVSAQDKEIAVKVAFERHLATEKRLYFDVEFTNNTAEPVIVDPGTFYCSAFLQATDSLTEKSQGFIIKAIDPEEELLALDVTIRDAISNRDKVVIASAVVDIALILVDKSEKTDEECRAEEAKREDSRIEGEIAHREHLDKLYAQRSMWEETALRKTTLLPGKSIRGLVALPADDRVRSLQFYLPCGNSENVATFRQEVF